MYSVALCSRAVAVSRSTSSRGISKVYVVPRWLMFARPRAIGGQLQHRERARELLVPVGAVRRQRVPLQPGAVPGGEVAVPDGQRRQRRRLPLREGAVELVQLLQERVERPAVPDDVVHHEEEHVLRVLQPVERGPVQRSVLEIEDHVGLDLHLRQRLAFGVRRLTQVDHRQRLERVRRHLQDRLFPAAADVRAQRLVTLQHGVEGALEGGLVQRAVDAERRRQVPHREPGLELLEEPHPLLHQRQRRLGALGEPGDGRDRGGLLRALRREQPRELLDGGRLEQLAHADHDSGDRAAAGSSPARPGASGRPA